jgi:phenylacetate-CoA oxygenase PaaI subunit
MESRTPPASAAVFALIARLADNKYYLGRRYAEWCSAAPELESGVAAAAMAQDELGHARAIYPLLRDLAAPDIDPAQVDPDTRTCFVNLAALDEPFAGWPDFVAANFLVDTALSTVFAAGRTSSFEPLAARSRKVLQEERVHAEHGEAWVRRLARGVPAVRTAAEIALLRIWDETLCWFGRPDERGALAEEGVLDATPDELRARFLAVVGPTIVASGLGLPVRRADDGQSWELTGPLPWREWDPATYRLDGAYEVERAGATPAPGGGRP